MPIPERRIIVFRLPDLSSAKSDLTAGRRQSVVNFADYAIEAYSQNWLTRPISSRVKPFPSILTSE